MYIPRRLNNNRTMINNEYDQICGIPTSDNLGDHNLLTPVQLFAGNESENPEYDTNNEERENNPRSNPAMRRKMPNLRRCEYARRGPVHHHARMRMSPEGN